MLSISSSTSAGMFPVPGMSSSNGFQILSGSIQDLNTWTTVYTNASATELLLSQTWVNGVFLFAVSKATIWNTANQRLTRVIFRPPLVITSPRISPTKLLFRAITMDSHSLRSSLTLRLFNPLLRPGWWTVLRGMYWTRNALLQQNLTRF